MNLRYLPFSSKLKGLLLMAFAIGLFFNTNARPNHSENNNPATTCSICNIPDAPFALNVTTNQVTLMWLAALDACSYTTRLREAGTTTWTSTQTVTSTTAIASGLVPGKTYEWQVRTNCCDNTFSGYSPIATFNTPLPCTNPVPTGLIATNILTNGAKLSWTAVTGATGYVLKYKVQGTSNWQQVNVTGNTYQLTGLVASTNYEFQLSTYANNCIGDPSVSATFTTAAIPTCAQVATPTIVSSTPTSCCIQWAAAPSACSYWVRSRVVGQSKWFSTQFSSTTQICIPNLSPGTTYECQVESYCCNGSTGPASNFLIINTSNSCIAPSSPTASNVTSSSVQLCWTGSPSATGYKVEYKTTAATVWTSVFSNTPCTTLYGLAASTTYQYRVSTYCGATTLSLPCIVNTFSTTAATATCTIPSGITCGSATSSGFVATWPAVSGACSYNIRLRVLGATTWAFTGALTSNKATISNATAGTSYEFQIQSVCCSGGTSGFSTLYTCTTTAFCPIPTGITFNSITNTTAIVNWAAAATATSYTVQYKATGTATWTSVNATSTSTTLYGLNANTAYDVQVIANCPNNCVSAPSTIATFTTGNVSVSCGVPINCVFSNLATTSCVLNWTAVSGACSYIIRVKVQGATTWAAIGYPTKNSANLTNLTPNTVYEWQVLAVCCTGTQGDYCPIQIVTTPNSCVTPTNVIASSIKNTSAALSWTAIPNALSYTVSYKTATETTWNTFVSPTNTFTIANLVPNTTYQYFVQTNCSATSQSGASVICTFKTAASSNCEMPLGLTVQNITTTSAQLSWLTSPSACAYKLRYRLKGTTTWSQLSVSGNSLSLSGLSAGTNYEWSVMSICCNNSFSAFAPTVSFVTNTACLTNDEPCSPSVVTVGEAVWSCLNGSNTCATGSAIASPTCDYSANDVWYKLIMPASGFATIAVCASPGMNPGVAVYSNNGCSNLTYLGCKYAVNGNSIAQISVQGPVGYALWIRVWGSANTTGTFSICAINKVVAAGNIIGSASSRGDVVTDVLIEENKDILTENKTLVLAPNPASSNVNIRFDATQNATQAKISVYDIQGRKVLTENLDIQKGENNTNLSVENLSTGTYILRIESVENFAPIRLMIQK